MQVSAVVPHTPFLFQGGERAKSRREVGRVSPVFPAGLCVVLVWGPAVSWVLSGALGSSECW